MATQEPQGTDALSSWRRRVRRRLLEWAPLSAWRGLLGIVVLLTAGVLRKVGVIHEPGYDLLLSLGLGMLGWGITVAQVKSANEKRKNGEGK